MIGVSILAMVISIVTIVTVSTGYKSLNSVWVFGPLYWVLRDCQNNKKLPVSISLGFMRQTSNPWRIGRGLQVSIGNYLYQIGVCRKSQDLDDQSGLLYAVKGRILDTPIKEIGDW